MQKFRKNKMKEIRNGASLFNPICGCQMASLQVCNVSVADLEAEYISFDHSKQPRL